MRYVNSHQCFEKVLEEESTRRSRSSAVTVPAAHETAEISYVAPSTKSQRVDKSFVLAEQVADRVFREVPDCDHFALALRSHIHGQGSQIALFYLRGIHDVVTFNHAHFASRLLERARMQLNRRTVELVWELHTLGTYCTHAIAS